MPLPVMPDFQTIRDLGILFLSIRLISSGSPESAVIFSFVSWRH